MAKLKSGTRIYGTAGIDTSLTVGSGVTITTTSISATGIVTASSGIVVAVGSTNVPSISPLGDSNTGIFFPSADTVAIGKGGLEVIRVDSSGRVGVGTNIITRPFEVWSGTAGTSFSVDSSGRVIMPYQPAFYVEKNYGNMSNFVTGATTAIATWDNIRLNQGSNFNSGTGRFTAPVTGIYFFSFHISSNTNSTDNSDYLFYKNGSGVSETVVVKSAGVSVWLNAALMMHISLNINDYVTVAAQSYNGNTGTVRASFGGRLLG